jgi:hypothetical protein
MPKGNYGIRQHQSDRAARPIPTVAIVYRLADEIERYLAATDSAWVDARVGQPVPASLKELRTEITETVAAFSDRHSVNPIARQNAHHVVSAIKIADQSFRSRFLGIAHRRQIGIRDQMDQRLGFELRLRQMLACAPFASPAWSTLRNAIGNFKGALDDDLREAFETGELLAHQLYLEVPRGFRPTRKKRPTHKYLDTHVCRRVNEQVLRLAARFPLDLGNLVDIGKLTHERDPIAKNQPYKDWAVSRLRLLHAKIAGQLSQSAWRQPVDPFWSVNRRQLYLGGELILDFGRRSPNAFAILNAFQDQDWCGLIANPSLPVARRGDASVRSRLIEAIKTLNRLLKPGTIRFHSVGLGEKISWRRCAHTPAPPR